MGEHSVDCRLQGSCAIKEVRLNGIQLVPLGEVKTLTMSTFINSLSCILLCALLMDIVLLFITVLPRVVVRLKSKPLAVLKYQRH